MVKITLLQEEELPFLIHLWQTPEVMRYADEFPRLRGWSRKDSLQTAWQSYQERRSELGDGYVQFILRLTNNTPIGESFFVPLPEGYTFGKWQKEPRIQTLMGDIKLMPAFWGQGLASAGMKLVVEWLFSHTKAIVLLVPPHRKNPAAERVYEKAGFILYTGMKSWYNHKVMTLKREEFTPTAE